MNIWNALKSILPSNLTDGIRIKSDPKTSIHAEMLTIRNGIIDTSGSAVMKMWDAAAPGAIRRQRRNKDKCRQQRKDRAKNRA